MKCQELVDVHGVELNQNTCPEQPSDVRVIVTKERCVVASGSALSCGTCTLSFTGLELCWVCLLFDFRPNCRFIIMVSSVALVLELNNVDL